MSRPMLSKKSASTSTPSNRKPSLESSVYSKLHDALALLPQRRSSPTKPSSSAQTTPAKKSSPFSIFSSSRHKPSSSAPPAVPVVGTGSGSISFLGNKAGTLPQQKALPTQPLPPLPPLTKSAPASRAVTPSVSMNKPAPPLPQVSSLRERSKPTIPFASSSRLLQPTAASSARTTPVVSTPTTRAPTLVHTRTPSKSRIEPPTPITPLSPPEHRSYSRSSRQVHSPTLDTPRRAAPSPTLDDPTTRMSSPTRPRPPLRTPTSPPSAFAMKSQSPPPTRSLGRKRSKTFPDPSDPTAGAPIPPPKSLSSSMNTANRILEAFDPSPRMNDEPESLMHSVHPRSKSTSPPPIRPVRPIRSPSDTAFMSIPSRARSPESNRILPSAASIEATASRARQAVVHSPTARSPTLMSGSASAGRSSVDQSLPPPPRKPMSPTLTSSGSTAQSRRIVRPKLQPLQTTPISTPSVSTGAVGGGAAGVARPITPETQPSSSSASPKTPAAYAYVPEPPCLTSDDEGRKNKRTLKSLFQRKQRPDSIITSSSYVSMSTSAVSASGTSNASAVYNFGAGRPSLRTQKGPGTFGGLPEEDEMPISTQTRHGIRRHAHAAADVPYPISFEEMVLQGEKHTQELLSTVLQQKAYHFTPMDNFAKLKNILDVGCGRGYWLSHAAKECKNATLIGFDIVDVFLTPQELRDRQGLNEGQIARIKFRQGNFFDSLPFPSGEFEYIRLAFLELAIPESKWVPLLKEAWRVLKPGGHIEVVIESQLFPTVWSYDKLPVQQELEDEFRGMLEARDIPPATNIGEKMFFDAFARVQTHQHVSVCIAPRPAGRSSLDGPISPRNFGGSMRSMHSPWSSEPVMSSGMVSPVPFGRPSLDRSRPSVDVLPPPGNLITSKTCTIPGIVISPDTFIPVSEETLFTYASHGAMVLNAARLAAFSDKYPDASPDEHEEEWQAHVERYWQYERSNRLRLGFRMKQFDDDDEDDDLPALGPTTGRWKWAKCDEDLERPLEIRRFRAWSLSKPGGSR